MRIWLRLFLTLIFMVISIVSLYIIKLGTANPGSGSGNGNPMIIIETISFPIFVLSFVFLYKFIQGVYMSRVISIISIFASFIAILILAIQHYLYIVNRLNLLGGGPDEPESWIYRYGWFNQYTNTFYFHVHVYAVIALTVVIAALWLKIRKLALQ